MKKTAIILIILFAVIIQSCASMKAIPYEKRLLIAVIIFQNKTGDPQIDKQLEPIMSTFINNLQESKQVRLIERGRLDAIIKEQNLGMSGLIDPNKASEVGKLAGADAVCIGDIHMADIDGDEVGIAAIGIKATDKTIEVKVSSRIIDSETGEILASGNGTGTADIESFKIGDKLDLSNSKGELKNAVDDAAVKACESLIEKIPPKR